MEFRAELPFKASSSDSSWICEIVTGVDDSKSDPLWLCNEIHKFYDLQGAKSFYLIAGSERPTKSKNDAVYKLKPYWDGIIIQDGNTNTMFDGTRLGTRLSTRIGRWLRRQYEQGARFVWIELDA